MAITFIKWPSGLLRTGMAAKAGFLAAAELALLGCASWQI